MKGLLILAGLLLVPSMAYYQKHHYASVLREKQAEELRTLLVEGGVEGAAVELDWMDATISGVVGTVARRAELATEVDGFEGVRLASGGNELRVRGWVELAREAGEWEVRGLLPIGFEIGMMKTQDAEGWNAELERFEFVEAPPGALGWEKFLLSYFGAPGDRSVELRNGGITLRGEATRELRTKWLEQASKVVSKDRVDEELVLRTSMYHFAGYQPESLRGEAEILRLRKELDSFAHGFEDGSVEVSDAMREGMSELAATILTAGERVRFVVGVTRRGETEEDLALAERQLAAIVALLGEYGVKESQLEKRVFVVTLDGAVAGQVEFLLK